MTPITTSIIIIAIAIIAYVVLGSINKPKNDYMLYTIAVFALGTISVVGGFIGINMLMFGVFQWMF